MGIDDRDHMRERYCQRKGHRVGDIQWNDNKGRVEGAWFQPKYHGLDYQKGRLRNAPPVTLHPAQKWIFLLSALTFLIPAFREAKRAGWIPETAPTVAFPATGSVAVNRQIDPKTATSRMIVTTDQANAVVQLFDRETDRLIISVYVGRQDSVTVPVPPGTYRMKVVEGDKWHGPARLFGRSTDYKTVAIPMVFTRREGSAIDLHRSANGSYRHRSEPTQLRNFR